MTPRRPLGTTALAVSAIALGIACGAGCSDTLVFDTEDPWNDPSLWPGIGEGKVLVTNAGDDTVSFLEPTTLEPVFRAPVGRIPAEREGPHHGAATADGSRYFVGISNVVPGGGTGPHGSHGTGTVDGYLLEYDTETNTRMGELRVDRSPGDVRISPDGRYVVQSHFDLQSILEAVEDGEDPRDVLSRLAVIDVATLTRVAMIPVCPAAHGIAFAPDSSAVYVACWGSDELAIVSLAQPITASSQVERFPIGNAPGDPRNPQFGPYAVIASPDGSEVWVSNLEGESLVVFDTATRAFDDTRRVFGVGAPLFGSLTDDGATLYAPMQLTNALAVVDTATGTATLLDLPTGECPAPHGVLIVSETTIGVVCEGDHFSPGRVARIGRDPASGELELEASFEVGVYPDDLVYIPGD